MKAKELREKSVEELNTELLNLLREKRPGGKKNGGNPPAANAQ